MDRELQNYEKYLNMITKKIEGFFEKQKPFIHCKKGCCHCCKKGEYPFSYIEYRYITEGYTRLNPFTQAQIREKIKHIKFENAVFQGEKAYLYECPFLINKACSVYPYRGIICRSFGLIAQREGKNSAIPFCADLGLNYSNVYDPETQKISAEMLKKTGIKTELLAYNVDYNFLTKEDFERTYGFGFGEKRRLIDWL